VIKSKKGDWTMGLESLMLILNSIEQEELFKLEE
jgi:hypothetical protein